MKNKTISSMVCLSIILCLLLISEEGTCFAFDKGLHKWSKKEIETLKSLWIGSLPPLPKDPANRYADDSKAAALGKKLFFDVLLSGDGRVSCSTCHQPEYYFTDPLPRSHGVGITTRRSMPLAGAAYYSFFFWDGRADSLWAQALGPPESEKEHGISRTYCAHHIEENYKNDYEEVFGTLPEFPSHSCPAHAKPDTGNLEAYKAWLSIPYDKRKEITTVYVNMGKAIAAFVRLIVPGPSRFDNYVEALIKGDNETMADILGDDEVSGLKLFIGKAKCINCHNGPLFTNSEFHNIGVPAHMDLPFDPGRSEGIRKLISSEFNCLTKHSDGNASSDCDDLLFLDTDTGKYYGAFKTPTLRNVTDRPPYMHAGQFKTVREVLEFYRSVSPGGDVRSDLEHSDLTDIEIVQIETFLQTLSGPIVYAK